jgi:hypothetical protein
MHWYAFEIDDQLINLLENLLSLVAYDRNAVGFIIKQQIK